VFELGVGCGGCSGALEVAGSGLVLLGMSKLSLRPLRRRRIILSRFVFVAGHVERRVGVKSQPEASCIAGVRADPGSITYFSTFSALRCWLSYCISGQTILEHIWISNKDGVSINKYWVAYRTS
jgi:hypothetical protein